ncbi:DNA-3-methyladenine glycosylase family protein [Tuberibacillus sp. Marseille-P3662]|uniref:DNA-3-methyladenine glycosylase family protein n=1 Tax=Tuberibacillus sp. Marseille-P3662 TaxID=1965358 RepID=UPI000A1CF09E|nr:DNA-3-methyladenine glycosylase 2 [Tuberibacillus sp. Marseille-P3662]
MQKKQTEIIPAQPYAFGQALAYIRTSPSSILEKIDDHGYHRVFTFTDQPVLVQMNHEGSIDNARLKVEVIGDHVDAAILNQAVDTLKRIFCLTVDPEPFHLLTVKDPILGGQMSSYRGLRPVLIGDPFEALVWAIIGQQINITFAKKLKLKLQGLCGDTFHFNGKSYPVFPKPEQIIALGEEKLRENQFSRQKAQYLITASRAVASGDIDFEALTHMSYDKACQSLMQFKGLGRWTAEYVLMRGLGFQDIIPAGDLGLQDIIGQFYKHGKRATEDEVRQIAKAWSPWRSWAAFVWWLQLQLAHFVEQKHRSGVISDE